MLFLVDLRLFVFAIGLLLSSLRSFLAVLQALLAAPEGNMGRFRSVFLVGFGFLLGWFKAAMNTAQS